MTHGCSQLKMGKPINLHTVGYTTKRAAQESGLQVRKIVGLLRTGNDKAKFKIHSHVFRRSWKHAMRQAGITDSDLLNFLMGHELPYQSAYDNFDAETVRKEYSKAEPFLTVMVNPEIARSKKETA